MAGSDDNRAPKKPRAPRKPKPPVRADMRMTGWIAILVIVLDQALKYWAVHILRLDRVHEINVLPPWLNLRMAWNQGVNFGLFSSGQNTMRWVLIGIAVAISVWVWVWIWRAAPGRLARISAGLLIGGAVGNVIDRAAYGAVADFLNMSLPSWNNPYSFNLADIAIFAGAVGLVFMPQKPTDGGAPKQRPRKPRSKPVAKVEDQAGDNPRDGGGK